MASRKPEPPKEEAKRPAMNFGPYPTDRQTSLEAAIWKNEQEGNEGSFTTWNVTIKRSYRTDSGEWKVNANYRPHDLPVLQHALNQAYAWIMEQRNRGTSED